MATDNDKLKAILSPKAVGLKRIAQGVGFKIATGLKETVCWTLTNPPCSLPVLVHRLVSNVRYRE